MSLIGDIILLLSWCCTNYMCRLFKIGCHHHRLCQFNCGYHSMVHSFIMLVNFVEILYFECWTRCSLVCTLLRNRTIFLISYFYVRWRIFTCVVIFSIKSGSILNFLSELVINFMILPHLLQFICLQQLIFKLSL